MKKILFTLSVLIVLLSMSCCSFEQAADKNETSVSTERIDAKKLKKILNGKIDRTRYIETGLAKNIMQVYDGIIFNTYNGVYKYNIKDDKYELIPNSEDFVEICEVSGTIYFVEKKRHISGEGRSNLFSVYKLLANGEVTEVFDNYEFQVYKPKIEPNNIIIKEKYMFFEHDGTIIYDYENDQEITRILSRRFCLTEDERFVFTEHNGCGNLREYNIKTRQQRILSGVGMDINIKKPIERECVNVFCHKNDIYYSTYRPYALWRYNENGEDTLIIQNDNVNSFYECYDRGTYMYILQCTMDKKSNDTSVCKYNYESGQVEEKWELSEVGYIERADIIGDVLVYEKNNKLLFKDIPVS